MREEKRKLVCRVGFLAICLLPTAVQLWSIFGAHFGQPWGHRQDSEQGGNVVAQVSFDPSQSGISGNDPADSISTVPPAKSLAERWAERQGIVSVQGDRSVSQIRLLQADLPDAHPLKKIPFEVAEIDESDSAFSIVIEKLSLQTSGLESIFHAFVTEEFHSVWHARKQNSVHIKELVFSRNSVANEQSKLKLLLRDVKVSILDQAFDRIQVSGRVVAGDPGSLDAVELPFLCQIAREGRSSMLELNGRGFPVWLLQPEISRYLGSLAEFNGKIKHVRIPNQPAITEFTGSLTQVDCGSLSATLSPKSVQLLTGNCLIQNLAGRIDGKSLVSLQGDIQSTSTGTVSTDIATALGPSVKWLGREAVESYRSYMISVNLANGVMSVRSQYAGGQLIWNDRGADVLIVSQ